MGRARRARTEEGPLQKPEQVGKSSRQSPKSTNILRLCRFLHYRVEGLGFRVHCRDSSPSNGF